MIALILLGLALGIFTLLAATKRTQASGSIEAAIRACTEPGTSIESRIKNFSDAGWIHYTGSQNIRALAAMDVVAKYGGIEFVPAEGTLADFFEAERRKAPSRLSDAKRLSMNELRPGIERGYARALLQHNSPLALLFIELRESPVEGSLGMSCKLSGTGPLDGSDARAAMTFDPATVAQEETEQTSSGATRHYLLNRFTAPEGASSMEFYDFNNAIDLHMFFKERGMDNPLTYLMRTGVYPVPSEASQ